MSSFEAEIKEMCRKARQGKITTYLDRQAKYGQKSIGKLKRGRCEFDSRGLCCSVCELGPCQLQSQDLPLYLKLTTPQLDEGLCGANSSIMQARNLSLKTIRGTAINLFLAKQAATALLNVGEGKSKSFSIKEPEVLKSIASKLKIDSNLSIEGLAKEVAWKALMDLEDFSPLPMRFLGSSLLANEVKELSGLNIFPNSGSTELLNAGIATASGANASWTEFIKMNLRLGLAGLGAANITVELTDILLGSRRILPHKIGFSCLEGGQVNIVIQTASCLIANKILEMSQAEEMIGQARVAGASGINVVALGEGVSEVSSHQGHPWLGVSLQQEFLPACGMVEAIVVDIDSIWPVTAKLNKKFHTKMITTVEGVRVEGDEHFRFDLNEPDAWAKGIVELSIENFKNRPQRGQAGKVEPIEVLGGFSVESCFNALARIDSKDPAKVLLDHLVAGDIRGIALLIGDEDRSLGAETLSSKLAQKLISKNILVLSAGGLTQDCARAGLLSAQATLELVDPAMGTFLCKLAQANGIKEAFPPLWSFGGCTDTFRALNFILALSQRLGVKTTDLPIVASIPESFRERWVSPGFGLIGLGITTHFPLAGQYLKGKMPEPYNQSLIVEPDPIEAASLLVESIDIKRTALNI